MELKSSIPGLRYPTFRDAAIKSSNLWLEGRRQDDNAEGLWRIHDNLYELSSWIDRHPGGSDWIEVTKGTDITEAFEVHHISQKPELILKMFYVRQATGPRNSPYTFKSDGFYNTLKAKVRKVLSQSPPGIPWKSMVIADTLLISCLVSAVGAAFSGSLLLGGVSGLLLALTVISAHNFFHQKDNIRMYYFALSCMSSRNWRVSHALSHHLYTNTVLDLEISMLEPFLQLLPRQSKSWWARYGSWFLSPIVYTFMCHHQLINRLVLLAAGYQEAVRKEDFAPFFIPLLMYVYAGCGITGAVCMWTWIALVSSFVFGFIGVNAAHHHPELFHDGDAPRVDRDWGLCQIDAVRDRPEISKCLFLVLVTFGDHCLHHLFPTIDHSHLHLLYPVFLETCKEFGVDYKPSSVADLIVGQFRQLANNRPNPNPHGNKLN